MEVNKENSFLLPIGLDLSNECLYSWLKSRIVTKNREYVDQLLSKMGLSHNDVLVLLKFVKVYH